MVRDSLSLDYILLVEVLAQYIGGVAVVLSILREIRSIYKENLEAFLEVAEKLLECFFTNINEIMALRFRDINLLIIITRGLFQPLGCPVDGGACLRWLGLGEGLLRVCGEDWCRTEEEEVFRVDDERQLRTSEVGDFSETNELVEIFLFGLNLLEN